MSQLKYLYLPYKLPHDARHRLWSPTSRGAKGDPYAWNEIMHRLYADGDPLVDTAESDGLTPSQFRGRPGRRVIWSDLDQDWGQKVRDSKGYYIGQLQPGQSNTELAHIGPRDRLMVLGHCGFTSIAMGYKTGNRKERGPMGTWTEGWDAYILGCDQICNMLEAGGLRRDIVQVELRGCFTGLASMTSADDFAPTTRSPLAREVARELGRRGYDRVYVAGYMHETSRQGGYKSRLLAGPGETGRTRFTGGGWRSQNWRARSRKIWYDHTGQPYTLTKRLFNSVWGFEGSRTINALEDSPNPFYDTEPVSRTARGPVRPVPRRPMRPRGRSRSVSHEEISMAHVVDLPADE